jgi:hypothetical protein
MSSFDSGRIVLENFWSINPVVNSAERFFFANGENGGSDVDRSVDIGGMFNCLRLLPDPLVITSITLPGSFCLLLNAYGDADLFVVLMAAFWACVSNDGDDIGVDETIFDFTPAAGIV